MNTVRADLRKSQYESRRPQIRYYFDSQSGCQTTELEDKSFSLFVQVQEPIQQHSQKLQIVLNIVGELRKYTYSVAQLFERLLVLEQCPNTKLIVNVSSQGANI